MTNHMKVEFEAKETNVGLARMVAAAFLMNLDPTIDEAEDVKVAVSEAVTNAIVHGYDGREGIVYMEAFCYGNTVMFSIKDTGKGIEDVKKAREPLFTSKPQEERSGLGFTVMESFMDSVHIDSRLNCGTTVTMTKRVGSPVNVR